jgi:uncharacterized OB-fold protein
MAKCKDCGEPVTRQEDPCPKCGLGAGATATPITDVPGVSVKKERKELFTEIKAAHDREEHARGEACPECGTKYNPEKDICPDCGISAGAAATPISDIHMPDLRAGHKKLKEEIKEARERDRE